MNVQRLLTWHNECQHGGNKFTPFTLGEKVWLEGTDLHLSHPSAKLALRHYRPFKVTKVISPVVYWLELPASWKIFGTFHALLLSPYHETQKHGTNYLEPPSDVIDGQEEYKVEDILDQRTHGRWRKKQYLVKWKGYSSSHNSWENANDMHTLELVQQFLQRSRRSARIRVLKTQYTSRSSSMSSPSIPLTSLYSLNSYILVNDTQQEQGQGEGHTTEEDNGAAVPQDLGQDDLLSRSDSSFVTTPIELGLTGTTSSACEVVTHHPSAPRHSGALWAFFNKAPYTNTPSSEEDMEAIYNRPVHHAGLAHCLLYPFAFGDNAPCGEQAAARDEGSSVWGTGEKD